MGDLKLLKAVGRGDTAAFSQLYNEFRPSMLAYATGVLAGDASAAEDAVNEAFSDIWRLAGRFNAVGNAGAWIRRIVRNKSIDLLRKTSGRESDQSDHFFNAITDEADDPEQSAMLQDERRWLRQALAILNVDQREVIVLCYFEGLSMHQIATMTECPTNTVKTRLHYARRKLFAWIEEQEERFTIRYLPNVDVTESTLAVA